MSVVPASPTSLRTSAAFCEISFVLARRSLGGSSGSSEDEDEEYTSDGAVDRGVTGSSGKQWVGVAVRR